MKLTGGTCCTGWAASFDGDNSQLHTAATNALFPGGAGVQPLPLPLGPAYNNSNFKAFVNVTVSAYADGPASSFNVNITTLSTLVNSLGKLYYPLGILFEVLLNMTLRRLIPNMILQIADNVSVLNFELRLKQNRHTCDSQVLSIVPANSNDPMVNCTIPQASGKMGVCVSMMVLLLDDTRTSFVKTSLDNVVCLSFSWNPDLSCTEMVVTNEIRV